MDVTVADVFDELKGAIDARNPEQICTKARLVRLKALHAKECLIGAWGDEEADAVRGELVRALQVLRDLAGQCKTEKEKLARFSWCRVYSRLQTLFPETAAQFADEAKDCELIVGQFVANAANMA